MKTVQFTADKPDDIETFIAVRKWLEAGWGLVQVTLTYALATATYGQEDLPAIRQKIIHCM